MLSHRRKLVATQPVAYESHKAMTADVWFAASPNLLRRLLGRFLGWMTLYQRVLLTLPVPTLLILTNLTALPSLLRSPCWHRPQQGQGETPEQLKSRHSAEWKEMKDRGLNAATQRCNSDGNSSDGNLRCLGLSNSWANHRTNAATDQSQFGLQHEYQKSLRKAG